LPVINKEAVRHVLRVGAAVSGTLADYSEFDRKSYFYPDIPKGYQISQYEYPLVKGGKLNDVEITRVHLEEDTARSSHANNASLVDFNRAGIPLMELVTEPVIRDAHSAAAFARELQLLLRTLGASEANLEKGEMRIEANISVSRDDSFGTKVEVKNLNSFRSVERAIEFEIERQIALYESGGKVVQETRGWDEQKEETFRQRSKEGSADYRYFPEPDLPKLLLSEISEFSKTVLEESLPMLPWEKRARYASLGLKENDAAMLLQNKNLEALFDAVVEGAEGNAELIALAGNYVVSDVAGLERNQEAQGSLANLSGGAFLELMRMTHGGEMSSRGTKDVLAILYEKGGNPKDIARENGLMQVSDRESLRAYVQQVLQEEVGAATEYRGGKESILQFLIGKAMKISKGAGNPALFKEILIEELSK